MPIEAKNLWDRGLTNQAQAHPDSEANVLLEKRTVVTLLLFGPVAAACAEQRQGGALLLELSYEYRVHGRLWPSGL